VTSSLAALLTALFKLIHSLQVDLAGRRRFSTEEIEQFSRENNFIHFMETSVKENINVEESMQ